MSCLVGDIWGEVSEGHINYLSAPPAVGGKEVAPTEGLIIREKAFFNLPLSAAIPGRKRSKSFTAAARVCVCVSAIM